MSDNPAHVRGLAELQSTLSKLPGKVQEVILVPATSAGAAVLQADMVAHAPVRQDGRVKRLSKRSGKGRLPGFLKANIGRRRVDGGSGTSVTFMVGVLSGAFYAIFQEFGTRHQAARPFVRTAAETKANEAVEKMAEKCRTGIDRQAAELGLKS